ncbi:substrate-binding domain-containing protein [Brachybacterium saurashtrense]|uniref:substrate-binding domain-containing protein n=1 Tax=Brachybacterium saurashtrense TaxID=556288 RepID=UPI0013B40CB4|nr:substrate-binding domain-containing protein [Brachybacterium saurashtrense]
MSSTLPSSRRRRVLEHILHAGEAQVSALAGELGVSPITIRRDITALADDGLVERVHGGARRLDSASTGARTASASGPAARAPAPVGAAGVDTSAASPGPRPRIAMVVPSLRYYWPAILSGASEAARALGVELLVQASTTGASANLAVVDGLAQDPQLDALIMAPEMRGGADTTQLLARLSALQIPVVITEREISGHGPAPHAFDTVRSDHSRGTASAVRHLVELGHTHLALATDPFSPTRPYVEDGFERAVEEFSLDPALVHRSILDTHGADPFAEIDVLLERCADHGTTAIIIHSDVAATLFLQHALRRGRSIPEDLSVVAYDDELSEVTRPALTAVGPAKRELGARAVALALQRLRHPEAPVEHVELLPALRVRETSAAPRTDAAHL